MKSKAAVLRGVGVDWEVTEVELDPPHAGEVLVKMAYAGICHSDEHFYTGDSVPTAEMEEMMRAVRASGARMVSPCSAATRAQVSSKQSAPRSRR